MDSFSQRKCEARPLAGINKEFKQKSVSFNG